MSIVCLPIFFYSVALNEWRGVVRYESGKKSSRIEESESKNRMHSNEKPKILIELPEECLLPSDFLNKN